MGTGAPSPRSLPGEMAGRSLRAVMLSMFVLWIVVFAGVFRGWRWTPILVLATLGWTLVLLRFHMTSDLGLEF